MPRVSGARGQRQTSLNPDLDRARQSFEEPGPAFNPVSPTDVLDVLEPLPLCLNALCLLQKVGLKSVPTSQRGQGLNLVSRVKPTNPQSGPAAMVAAQ